MNKWVSFIFLVTILLGFRFFLNSDSAVSFEVAQEKPVARQAANIELSLPKPRAIHADVGGLVPAPGTDAHKVASAYLELHGRELGIQPYHRLVPRKYDSPLQSRVVYDIYDERLWIQGLSLELVIADGKVESINNNYRPVKKFNGGDEPLVRTEEAVEKIRNRNWSVDPSAATPTAYFLVTQPGSDSLELAYSVPMYDENNPQNRFTVLFRGKDGAVIKTIRSRKN